MRRVIGFDQATEAFGFGVIDVVSGAPVYVACGVLHAPGGWPRFRRLQEIHADIKATLAEYAVADTDVVLEGGVDRYASAALAGGEARGIAMGPLFDAGVTWERIHEIAPTQMKLAIAGHGRAPKASVAAAVKLSLGMRQRPELDAADALGLALAFARGVRGTKSKMRRPPRAVIASGS